MYATFAASLGILSFSRQQKIHDGLDGASCLVLQLVSSLACIYYKNFFGLLKGHLMLVVFNENV